MRETTNFPWLAEFYRFEVIEPGMRLLTGLIERGITQGEFRTLPAAHVARMCVAPVLLSAIWRVTFAHLDPEPYDYKALIDTHLDVLFRGLAAGRRSAMKRARTICLSRSAGFLQQEHRLQRGSVMP